MTKCKFSVLSQTHTFLALKSHWPKHIDTILINLNVLENEIIELTALIVVDANQKTSTAEHEEAKALLENAQAIASYARLHVSDKGYNEPQEMLGQVYGAMNLATSARRLLNACRPF